MQHETRRFRRGLLGSIVVLAVVSAALGTASVLQGPRIQGTQLDLSTAVAAPGLLRIVLDEAVAPIDDADVTITPQVPASIQADGSVVLVQFDRALDYDTEYSVELSGVTAAGGGVAADLRHAFRTPEFSATWLERTASGDAILTGAPGSAGDVLHTDSMIQDFVPLPGDALFVVRLDETGTGYADIVATDGTGNVEHLVLPAGEPSSIEIPTLVGTDVLYTFSTLDPGEAPPGTRIFDDTLFRLDLEGSHISEPVLGIDGSTLAVDTLVPVPGSTTVLIHTRAGDLLRYDPAVGDPPTLLAGFSELGALSGDGRRATVADALGPLIYDLTDGTEARIAPSPVEGTSEVPYIGDIVPLSGDRIIDRVAVPDAEFKTFDVFIGIDDGTTTRSLLRPADLASTILDFFVTANERYLVAEVSPGGAHPETSDGYPVDPRPGDVVTVVVDITTGEIVGQWEGSHPCW